MADTDTALYSPDTQTIWNSVNNIVTRFNRDEALADIQKASSECRKHEEDKALEKGARRIEFITDGESHHTPAEEEIPWPNTFPDPNFDFMQFRSGKIGASEIADVFGLGYNSRIKLFYKCLFETPVPDAYLQRKLDWGKIHEADGLQEFWRITGELYERPARSYSHPDNPRIVCTPDAFGLHPGHRRIIEVKCPYGRYGYDALPFEEVRINHYIQVQMYLGCLRNPYGFNSAHLVCWTEWHGTKIWSITFDGILQDTLLSGADQFFQDLDRYRDDLEVYGDTKKEFLKRTIATEQRQKTKNKAEMKCIVEDSIETHCTLYEE